MSDGLDWMDQALGSGLPETVAALVPPPAPTIQQPAQQVEPGQPRQGEFIQSRRVVKPAPVEQQPQEIAVVYENTVSELSYHAHPDSYFPRVFTFVRSEALYYEQLKTGESICRKASPENRDFDFWITDTDYVANVGVYRTATGRRS